jgi:hypothetical protein
VDERVGEEGVGQHIAEIFPKGSCRAIERGPDSVEKAGCVGRKGGGRAGPGGTTASEESAAVIEESARVKGGERHDAAGGGWVRSKRRGIFWFRGNLRKSEAGQGSVGRQTEG